MDDPARNPWRTIDSRVVYRGELFVVREDEVIRPTGVAGVYPVIEMPAAVGVVARNEDGMVALVRQWRYPHDKLSVEIPTGGVLAGELVLDAAQRELAEETGLRAEHWSDLGPIDTSNGSTTEVAHLFLATALTLSPPVEDDPNERAELLWLPLEEAARLAVVGEIVESASVAGLLKVAYAELSLPDPGGA